MRSRAEQQEKSPHSSQLEKACVRHQRPNSAKKENLKKKEALRGGEFGHTCLETGPGGHTPLLSPS